MNYVKQCDSCEKYYDEYKIIYFPNSNEMLCEKCAKRHYPDYNRYH